MIKKFLRTHNVIHKIYTSLFLAMLTITIYAQQQDAGVPYIKNYYPTEYGAHVQNFDIAQDKRELMYFANFSGILEFDGQNWRIIQTTQISQVMALTCDNSGKIYVGARGEIGYLQADSIGDLQFKSLISIIPKGYESFIQVLGVFNILNTIYFVTEKAIFVYNGKQITVIKTSGIVSSAFYVNQKLYVFDNIDGLQYLKGNTLYKIDTGDMFSKATIIKSMISNGSNSALIATSSDGIKLLNANGISTFTTTHDSYLRNNNISCGIKLQDNTFAFGTEHGGLIVFYPDGTLKQIVNSGLQDNNIHKIFVDKTNHLWLALDNGIAQVEIPSSFSYFDERKGVKGAVKQVLRNNSTLYFATQKGLFLLNSKNDKFEPINGIESTVWSMIADNSKLLVASSKGVFLVSNKVEKKITSDFALVLRKSLLDESIVYVGHLNGTYILKKTNGTWHYKTSIPNFSDEVTEIIEEQNGNVWFLVETKGLIKYNSKTNTTSTIYNENKGLPFHYGNHMSIINNKLIISTQKGLYSYNNVTDRFEPIQKINNDKLFPQKWIFKMQEDNAGNIWYVRGDQKNISIKSIANKQASLESLLQPIKQKTITDIYCEKDNTIWFAGTEGAIRFNPINKIDTLNVKVLLRSVYTKNDKVLFLGTFTLHNTICIGQPESEIPELEYTSNSIAFSFSSPSYSINEAIEFQYILEGFDKTWSLWSKENQKEYTNLPAGNYVFKVRARNVFGIISKDISYNFIINKPFYQSYLAFLLYIVTFVLIVIVTVKARSKKLIKEKKKLENLIEERTAEVVSQKVELETQSKELTNKNKELEKINLIVKAINSEIHFSSLLQSILDKIKIINAVEKASIIVRDKSTSLYSYKLGYGWRSGLPAVELQLNEIQDFYLFNADEIYEDIYSVKKMNHNENSTIYTKIDIPQSTVVMIVKLSDEVEGFLVLENMRIKQAFDMNDFSLLRNLKEHIISAFIKTNLLENIQKTLENLKETQNQLIEKEKLASIGQLTKGIVDRILNPLNYINNFSILTNDLTSEIVEIFDDVKDKIEKDIYDDLLEVLNMVKSNVQKITEHGNSATRIVKGMEKILHQKSTEFIETDINALIEVNANRTIQEYKNENIGFEVNLTLKFDKNNQKIMLLPIELGAVFTNTINNACYVLNEKAKKIAGFIPEITVSTIHEDENTIIKIKDNGCGISEKEKEQLFSPFFTTKPTSIGTGLGLYLNLEIVKLHNGTLSVETVEDEFTCFIITLPLKK